MAAEPRTPPAGSSSRLAGLRRELHALAEPPGEEARTAAFMAERFASCRPARLLTGLGGHGLAALFRGREPGPRVGLRAELDALPAVGGARHGCGHDGHLALLAGVALHLREHPLARGEVVLLCQPAEETGQGAARLLADPRWPELAPELVFALHNLPGRPLGQVVLRSGLMCPASVGMRAWLRGVSSHAAQPGEGRSPAPVMARLLAELPGLAREGEMLTLVHARLGREGFGSTPGEALVCATLRAAGREALAALKERTRELTARLCQETGLDWRMEWPEPFAPTRNHPSAVELVRRAAAGQGLALAEPGGPMPWSEDFGRFTESLPGALFCLGAGRDHPPLHAEDYEFPDALLAPGLGLWLEVISQATARPAPARA